MTPPASAGKERVVCPQCYDEQAHRPAQVAADMGDGGMMESER
jgi:hypothetical protein